MTGTGNVNWRLLVLVPGTFFATAVLTGGAVTAIFEPRIEFSLFLGIPAGLLTGVLVSAFVAAELVSRDSFRRRIAMGVAGFSLAYLLSFVGALLILDAGVVGSLVLAIVLGLAGGVLAYVRSNSGTSGHPGLAVEN